MAVISGTERRVVMNAEMPGFREIEEEHTANKINPRGIKKAK
jgi:hypothetical protein